MKNSKRVIHDLKHQLDVLFLGGSTEMDYSQKTHILLDMLDPIWR